ncbi:MAG: hypothetical protein WBM54_11125 [Woeseia sp.]
MLKKDAKSRDAFTLSLGGMRTVAPFVFAPALPNDRINKIRDRQLQQAGKDRSHGRQNRQQGHGQTAQSNCA